MYENKAHADKKGEIIIYNLRIYVVIKRILIIIRVYVQ